LSLEISIKAIWSSQEGITGSGYVVAVSSSIPSSSSVPDPPVKKSPTSSIKSPNGSNGASSVGRATSSVTRSASSKAARAASSARIAASSAAWAKSFYDYEGLYPGYIRPNSENGFADGDKISKSPISKPKSPNSPKELSKSPNESPIFATSPIAS